MALAIALAIGTTACSQAQGDPMPYDRVVDAVSVIAYEPDRLSELLGHRVVLELRPFGAGAGYYVDEAHQISFRCGERDADFDAGERVTAKVVDVESRPNGVTTIGLEACAVATRERGTD